MFYMKKFAKHSQGTISLALVLVLLFSSCGNKEVLVINGHAHNDYDQERPLIEALDNRFISVEVDVHYVDGQFFVCHDKPENTTGLKTLEAQYLDPLMEMVNQRGGHIYPNYNGFLYLMIDVKTDATQSYQPLKQVLKKYEDMISVVSDSVDQTNKPIKIFLSGHHGRPYQQLISDTIKYAGLDGRPDELGLGIPFALMPVISQRYDKLLSWEGDGEPDKTEIEHLKAIITKAHMEDKKVRLWASPEKTKVWDMLLNLGVDLINTDRITEYREFVEQNN